MPTVTGLTAARMLAIEAASVVSGAVSGRNLILTKYGGGTIDAGVVKGTGFYSVIVDVSNISAVSGSSIGDYFVNGDTVNHTILGQTVTPGGIVKATSATAATAAGNIRGATGATGPTGSTGAAGTNGTNGTNGSGVFVGMIFAHTLRNTPALCLPCDGSPQSRTTYQALFDAICPVVGTPTVTIASPGVFTLNAHGFQVGDGLFLTTTGALPTGLAANTMYYVSAVTTNTFSVSATYGGSNINTTGSQSGVHTVRACAHGLGNGTTTFNMPDFRGRGIVGAFPGTGAGGGLSGVGVPTGGATIPTRVRGAYTGEETHTLTANESGVNGNGSTTSSGAGATSTESANHTHSGTTNGADRSLDHTHNVTFAGAGGSTVYAMALVTNGATSFTAPNLMSGTTGGSLDHLHGFSTGNQSANHTHDRGAHSHPLTARQADTPHNVMQPVVAVPIAIYAGV